MKNKRIEWFSAFTHIVPAEYEKWFEDLAAKGWHPQHVGHFSGIMGMTFAKSEPTKYRYVVDLQVHPKKEYKATYESFGWEYVGQMSSVRVWRKKYENNRPESFSDSESLMKRNKRFFATIPALFFLFLAAAIGITVAYPIFFSQLNAEQHITCITGLLVSYGLTLFLGYVLKKIRRDKL